MNLRLQAEEAATDPNSGLCYSDLIPKILAAFEKVRNEALQEAAEKCKPDWCGARRVQCEALKEPSEEREHGKEKL